MKSLIAAMPVLTGVFLAAAMPAAAQDAAGDKVNQLIIYGDDECPVSQGGEITVCARKAEEERYRIPEPLRNVESPANTAWTQKVMAYEMVGRNGINSCTPVGAGSELGCTQKLIDAAYAERENGADVRFGQLIAEAREERLSSIDVETAEQQAQVEQAEKEYAERQAAEQAAGQVSEPAYDPNMAPPPLPGADEVPAQ